MKQQHPTVTERLIILTSRLNVCKRLDLKPIFLPACFIHRKLLPIKKIAFYLSLFLLQCFFNTVFAATIISVDSTLDGADIEPGDGFCLSISGGCTLRAAIQEANALIGDDIIEVPAGTYSLSVLGRYEDLGASGDLDVFNLEGDNGGLEIRGQGASPEDTIIQSNRRDTAESWLQLFDRIVPVHPSAGTVILKNLTLAQGMPNGDGESKARWSNGGGLLNQGPDTRLLAVNVAENTAPRWVSNRLDESGIKIIMHGIGGGIYNDEFASLLIESSYIGYNLATGIGVSNATENGFSLGDFANSSIAGGGGVYNRGKLEIKHSRIEDNQSLSGGGGITNAGGTLAISDSIVAFNTASLGSGGGIHNWGGLMNMSRSIVSSNRGANLDGLGIANHPGANAAGNHPGIAVITYSQIENNQGDAVMGLGVSNFSSMYIGYSAIAWNGGSGTGMGVTNLGEGDLTIENSTILGNFTQFFLTSHGVGIHSNSALRLNQVTVVGNFDGKFVPPDNTNPEVIENFAEELFIDTFELNGLPSAQRDIYLNDPNNWISIKNSIIGDEDYRRRVMPWGFEASVTADTYCGGGYSDHTPTNGFPSFSSNIYSSNDYLALIHSEDYNLSQGTTCGLSGPNDQPGIPAKLLDAGDYGGPRLPVGPFLGGIVAIQLAGDSTGLDVVPPGQCVIDFDQRIYGRPVNGNCDIGAIENGAAAVPYADLELTVSSQEGAVDGSTVNTVPFGGSVDYTVIIKNHGPDAANNLSGLGRPVDGLGEPRFNDTLLTTFEFLGLKVIDATYEAPENSSGQVSCEIVDQDGVEITDCNYDRPLLVDEVLKIYLTVSPTQLGWSLSNSAEVFAGSPGDPVSFNNRMAIRNVIGVGSFSGPRHDNSGNGAPVESAGAFTFAELGLILLFFFFVYRRKALFATLPLTSVITIIGTGLLLFGSISQAAVPSINQVTSNPPMPTPNTEATITIIGTGFEPGAKVALLNNPQFSAVSATTGAPQVDFLLKQGNTLYLSWPSIPSSINHQSVSLYDISNPLSPSLIKSFSPLPRRRIGGGNIGDLGNVTAWAINANNELFMAITESTLSSAIGLPGIVIYDVSNPAMPRLIHHHRGAARKDGLRPSLRSEIMSVDDEFVYLPDAGAGSILSLRNVPWLSILDSSVTNGASIVNHYQIMPVDNSREVEASYANGVPMRYRPYGPRQVKAFSVPTGLGLRRFVLIWGRVMEVVIDNTPAEGTLLLLETTDPTNPIPRWVSGSPVISGAGANPIDVDIKLFDDSGVTKVHAVAVAGGTSITPHQLAIFDIGPDTGFSQVAPIGSYSNFNTLVDQSTINGRPLKVAVDGDTAMILECCSTVIPNPNGYSTQAYWEFDISDASAPILIGGPYSDAGENPRTADTREYRDLIYEDGFIYGRGVYIYQTNPRLTDVSVSADGTTITATVPAGYRDQVYDVVVTNPAGDVDEAISHDSFTVFP